MRESTQLTISVAAHLLLAFGLPPLLPGIINKTKALFAGRSGPPLLQPYYDLLKLLRKETVLSATATWIFLTGPAAGLAAGMHALLIVPWPHAEAPISFVGDFLLLTLLLGLGRFFTALAALDTGSAFEGMGAAREMTFACLAEPALLLGLLVLAKLSGSLQLSSMLGGSLAAHWNTAGATLALVLLSWLIVLLAENSRIPFDDPNTHLELTMIHEVMVLDHSGPALAMIEYAASIKLYIFSALVVRLAVPIHAGGAWLDGAVFIAGLLGVAVGVGVVESIMARLRMPQSPVLLLAACLLSAFGAILLVR